MSLSEQPNDRLNVYQGHMPHNSEFEYADISDSQEPSIEAEEEEVGVHRIIVMDNIMDAEEHEEDDENEEDDVDDGLRMSPFSPTVTTVPRMINRAHQENAHQQLLQNLNQMLSPQTALAPSPAAVAEVPKVSTLWSAEFDQNAAPERTLMPPPPPISHQTSAPPEPRFARYIVQSWTSFFSSYLSVSPSVATKTD